MEARDRRCNLGLFLAALIAWVVVGAVLVNLDPRSDVGVRYLGAGLIGVASGLTVTPLFWLLAFARQRRIAYRGDWTRAIRRGAWIAFLVGVVVVLRLDDLFQIPIALFLAALVIVAEASLSTRH
jgi:hypothetical protein